VSITHARKKELHWGQPVPPHLKHGQSTYARDTYGCQCEVCRPVRAPREPAPHKRYSAEQQAEWRRRQRLAHWGAPVPEGLKHGRNSYVRQTYGCDCAVCLPTGKRNAQTTGEPALTATERGRRLRKSKRGMPVPPGLAHGAYVYKTYSCRCDVCRAANANKDARHRTAWLKTARGIWGEAFHSGEKVVTICWPPKTAGPDWKCPDPSHLEAA
jgi:hypothetical protein